MYVICLEVRVKSNCKIVFSIISICFFLGGGGAGLNITFTVLYLESNTKT